MAGVECCSVCLFPTARLFSQSLFKGCLNSSPRIHFPCSPTGSSVVVNCRVRRAAQTSQHCETSPLRGRPSSRAVKSDVFVCLSPSPVSDCFSLKGSPLSERSAESRRHWRGRAGVACQGALRVGLSDMEKVSSTEEGLKRLPSCGESPSGEEGREECLKQGLEDGGRGSVEKGLVVCGEALVQSEAPAMTFVHLLVS